MNTDALLSCTACSLSKTRTQVVAGEGPLDAKIALIGEAPGRDEDLEGRPFVGRAGRHLDGLLEQAGLSRDACFVTNLVHCRPVDNNIRSCPDAVVTCPNLWLVDELSQLGYLKVIVALGATAGQKWFPGKTATEMAGMARACLIPIIHQSVVVVGSYHPSYALREGAWVDESIIESLRRAKIYAEA